MSNRRQYDEEDDCRDGPRKSNTGLYVFLGVVGAGFVAVILVIFVGMLMWSGTARVVPKPAAPGGPTVVVPAPGTKVIRPRAEFKNLVTGKTTEQVKAAVGPPDSTTESGTTTFWYFDTATTDPETGKVDIHAQVVVQKGVVVRVNFLAGKQ